MTGHLFEPVDTASAEAIEAGVSESVRGGKVRVRPLPELRKLMRERGIPSSPDDLLEDLQRRVMAHHRGEDAAAVVSRADRNHALNVRARAPHARPPAAAT